MVFLPGLMGSELYVGDENELWQPNWSSDVEKLFLNTDGMGKDPDIFAKKGSVVETVWGTTENIYKSFLADLASWKNEEKIRRLKQGINK